MYRIIYASRHPATPGPEAEVEIGDIVRASIANNRLNDVTGLLLVHEGWFIQALEGPEGSVRGTYMRILQDRRHRNDRLLCANSFDAREFADWNMCVRRFNPADDQILDALSQRYDFDPTVLDGQQALRMLKAVRGEQLQARRAA